MFAVRGSRQEARPPNGTFSLKTCVGASPALPSAGRQAAAQDPGKLLEGGWARFSHGCAHRNHLCHSHAHSSSRPSPHPKPSPTTHLRPSKLAPATRAPHRLTRTPLIGYLSARAPAPPMGGGHGRETRGAWAVGRHGQALVAVA